MGFFKDLFEWIFVKPSKYEQLKSREKCEMIGHEFIDIFMNKKCLVQRCARCMQLKLLKSIKLEDGTERLVPIQIYEPDIIMDLGITDKGILKILKLEKQDLNG